MSNIQTFIETIKKRNITLHDIHELIKEGAISDISAYKLESTFDAAIEANRVDILDLLLVASKYDINQTNTKGQILLHVACSAEFPNLNIVRYLLDRGALVNNEDYYGQTPLHFACNSNNAKLVELLIQFGANVNYVNPNSDCGCPPIYIAILSKATDIAELLLKYGANKIINSRLESPLRAALIHSKDIAKLILKYRVNFKTEQHDWTELSLAVFDANVTEVKKLINRGTEIDRLCLYSAGVCKNVDILEIIWKNVHAELVSQDVLFIGHIFDNWQEEDRINKLWVLLSRDDIDLHVDKNGRSFTNFITRFGTEMLKLSSEIEFSEIITGLVKRGLRLNVLEIEVILDESKYPSFGKQLFKIIINATLPNITRYIFCRGVENGVGIFLTQYCLDLSPRLFFFCSNFQHNLELTKYCLGIFTVSESTKNYIIDNCRTHGTPEQLDEMKTMLGKMGVKSLVELSRDVIRSSLRKNCLDARQFITALNQLHLPKYIKDVIQCKVPVNNYIYYSN